MIPERVTIHCSDTDDGLSVNLKAIERDHVLRKLVPSGVGYHVVIQPDGTIVFTRPFDDLGGHVGMANSGNIGICLAGRKLFTRAQFESLFTVIKRDILGAIETVKPWEIHVHHEFPTAIAQKKACPNMSGNRIRYWLLTEDFSALDPYVLKEREES